MRELVHSFQRCNTNAISETALMNAYYWSCLIWFQSMFHWARSLDTSIVVYVDALNGNIDAEIDTRDMI